jgi:predicted ATP-binding protein involved in virulence
MKLRKVKLKNFRCFDDFEIEFSDDNVHVLIAENMVGKSALLAGLRIAIGGYLRSISKAPQILVTDHKVIGENPISDIARLCVVNTSGTLVGSDGMTYEAEWVNVRPNPSVDHDTFAPDHGFANILEISGEVYDGVAEKGIGVLPLILFSGADYMTPAKNSKVTTFENGYTDKGYADCLDKRDSSSFIFSWLKFIDDILEEQKVNEHSKTLFKEVPSISMNLFKTVLNLVLPQIQSIAFTTVRGQSADSSVSQKELTFKIESGEVRTLDQLSDGYRYLVFLAGELAIRSFILNKHLFENANNVIDGVVLIDEFGIHLHPELQTKALDGLSKAFPNVQFIVTTHSPLMLNGLKKEQVHILEMDADKRTVRHPDRDIVGMGAEGILLEVFGLKTTFDDETVVRVRQLQALSQKRVAEGLTDAETAEFARLMGEVGILGYDTSLQDPLYRKFLQKYRALQANKGDAMRGLEETELDMDALADEAIREMFE